MVNILGLIPARYESDRFPGKPLADILGKPMIWWTYQRAKQAHCLNDIYVCTDSEEIKNACESFDISVIMTSKGHATGTDRIAEASMQIKADYYINIQGDEPLIDPNCIDAVCNYLLENPKTYVACAMTEITDPVDAINPTIPKMVTSFNNRLIYASRAVVPFPKNAIDYKLYRQVCIYGFALEALKFFADHPNEGPIENIEGIELLRYIEYGCPVHMVYVESNNISVDTKKDIEKVRKIMVDLSWVQEMLKSN